MKIKDNLKQLYQ